MELPLYNQQAEQIGITTVQDRVFGAPMNHDLLYQVTTSQIANKRQVIAHAKGRSEVRGGGKKPWQQKGTGRARHGSIRSPIWKGGGVTHGPTKERNFKKQINKKMVASALRVALSSKVRDRQMVIIDTLTLGGKTKEMAAVLKNFTKVFGKASSVLLVMPAASPMLYRAARNLPSVTTIEDRNLNPLAILSTTYIIMPHDSVGTIEKLWGKK